jgi:hypothetical protein
MDIIRRYYKMLVQVYKNTDLHMETPLLHCGETDNGIFLIVRLIYFIFH